MPEPTQELPLRRWRQAQAASDRLWEVIRPEALYDRPVPERHRLVFYLGHLEAFDWNLLSPPLLGLAPFHPEWDRLFAFGIDPVEGELPQDEPGEWPAIAEVGEYNRLVRERLGTELERGMTPEGAQRLEVALEHRWMHVETLSYLFHNLPYDRKFPGPPPMEATTPPDHGSVAIPAGLATLGQPQHNGFGWDNEFDVHAVAVAAFAADRFKVSNGDYLQFVQAGAAAPHFWRRRGNGWYYHGMFAETPLPLDQPVYATHAEASAYAGWVGKALPTEAQWHRMAYGTPTERERRYPWGEAAPAPVHGNFDLRQWDPAPVSAYPAGASAWGVEGLVGNGWEWTATPFGPFPGFQPFAFYPGYSANFFDGKHFVLKGASPRTAACLTRRSFRNWFQPHYPYLYAGFRCVAN